MGRTQVYLTSAEIELLDRAMATTGATRSELIRRAIQDSYGESSTAEKMLALAQSAGSWRRRRFTGAEYVDQTRGDLRKRLDQLGLK
jgi:hypothetical protein